MKQTKVDDLVVDVLANLESLPKEYRKSFVDFTLQALLINAEIGFPSSQHNYAALHNAAPSSLLQKLIPQDRKIFIKWTRKAAAQKEPRALFNLATRMADDEPVEGISRDLPTAYMLLAYLKHHYSKSKDLPPGMMAYTNNTMSMISNKLGASATHKLDAKYELFDFSSLDANSAVSVNQVGATSSRSESVNQLRH